MPGTSPDVIYRYQPMRPDAIDLIGTGRLWFSDPSRFNDPFDFLPSCLNWQNEISRCFGRSREEAYWTNPSVRSSRESFLKATENQFRRRVNDRIRAEQRKFTKGFAKNFRVACFSEHNDSILMWSHYSLNHSGLCIGIRPARIPARPDKALRWKVTYQNERLPIDHGKFNEIALRKAKAWEYEKEWRIVMATGDLSGGKRPLSRDHRNHPSEPGYFLRLPWDAIESVRFGVFVDRKKRSTVLKALQAEERSHIDAIQMRLSVDRFELKEEVLRKRC